MPAESTLVAQLVELVKTSSQVNIVHPGRSYATSFLFVESLIKVCDGCIVVQNLREFRKIDGAIVVIPRKLGKTRIVAMACLSLIKENPTLKLQVPDRVRHFVEVLNND